MKGLMPLPKTDYETMGCSHNDLFRIVPTLPVETQYYVTNTTHRLAEVDWITRRLERDVRRNQAPVAHEGLLALQMYLLLTCADTLGHTYYASGGVGDRFRAFFTNLPQDARQNLVNNIITWKTDFTELVTHGLADATTRNIQYPRRQLVLQMVHALTPGERFEAIVDFLYARRNYYTHESTYPQLGHHPNLSVMQKQRLGVSGTATLGDFDRLQPMSSGNDIYFTYYETADAIATIRWSIVRGLGRVVGLVT